MAQAKITAEVSGSIWKVLTSAGAKVADGDELFIIESMKMEIPVSAPAAGTVASVSVTEGQAVEENQVLAMLDT